METGHTVISALQWSKEKMQVALDQMFEPLPSHSSWVGT